MLNKVRLAAIATLCLVLPLGALGTPPNIVLILSDDHGVDLGSYGNKQVATPNLDALAKQGMLFERAFATQAVCSPSRSSIYTGLSPLRHGGHRNHTQISPGIKTMPDYFQSLGYRVALAGKTHFGPMAQFPFEYLPQRPNTFSDSRSYISRYFSSMEKVFTEGSARPFLLVVSTFLPHSVGGDGGGYPPASSYLPQQIALPGYLADTLETRSARAGYYELVTAMDRDIGTVLDLLAQSGAAENTLVVYASDHGSGFPFEKWTNYSAGLQVPLIVRYDGIVAPGSRSAALVSLADLLPTFVELAGGESIPELDGESFVPVLINPKKTHHQYVFATHTTLGNQNATDAFPIRSVRSQRYHYIQNLNPRGRFTNNITEKGQGAWFSWQEAARADEFARARVAAYQRRPAEEFYDIEYDPFELTNLAEDPQYAQALSEHRDALQRWRQGQGDLGMDHPGTSTMYPEMVWHGFKMNMAYKIYNYLN